MTHDAVRFALETLAIRIREQQPRIAPTRLSAEDFAPAAEHRQLAHCLWLCEEALTWPPERREKAMRWLCFVQGVLWSRGLVTIDEMKRLNAPPDAVFT